MNLVIHPYHLHHLLLLKAANLHRFSRDTSSQKTHFLGEAPIALFARLENTPANNVAHHAHVQHMLRIINRRHACAARVTVLGLCLCLCVCL